MLSARFKITIYILLFAILLCSCSDENVIDASNGNNNPLGSILSGTSYDIYLVATTNTVEYDQGNPAYQNFALFFDTQGDIQQVTSVELNGDIINQVLDETEVTFDGSTNHIWEVTDSNFPSFNDTLKSLNTFYVTYPRAFLDTIDASSLLSVAYSSISDLDSIYVEVSQEIFLTKQILNPYYSQNDPNKATFTFENTGSFDLTSSDLSAYDTDAFIRVKVYGVRYKESDQSGFSVVTANIVTSETTFKLY